MGCRWLQWFAHSVRDLGLFAEGDGAVGAGEGEAFAFPERTSARVGIKDAEIQVLFAVPAGLMFDMAQ